MNIEKYLTRLDEKKIQEQAEEQVIKLEIRSSTTDVVLF